MIPRFYCPPEDLTLQAGEKIDLPEALAHHALRVLRLRIGEDLVLFNGDGGEFPARVIDNVRRVQVQLGEKQNIERESPLNLSLVQALPSGDKMDWIVQKAVELGVNTLQPIQSARSVTRLSGTRAEKRVQHWQQIAIAASEQCGRNRLLHVEPILDFAHYLTHHGAENSLRLLLSPRDGQALKTFAAPTAKIDLLIGPEGGLTAEEENLARRQNFQAATLGPRVLRTETAGLAATAALLSLWGDF